MRILSIVLLVSLAAASPAAAQDAVKVLATNKTSTLEKEMNDAADAGYRFAAVMGGDTSFGGSEAVVVMTRSGAARAGYAYRLLATNKTGTMQKELQEAGDAGFEYKGQTTYKSAFGGKEVVVLLERDRSVEKPQRYHYRLVATKKTSTLQKELSDATAAGYEFVGMTVSDTMMGGAEVVCILRRKTTT